MMLVVLSMPAQASFTGQKECRKKERSVNAVVDLIKLERKRKMVIFAMMRNKLEQFAICRAWPITDKLRASL